MNASIDFWLDELDTQVMEPSPEQLHAIRAGVPPKTEQRAPGATRVDTVAGADGSCEWPTWSGVAAAALA